MAFPTARHTYFQGHGHGDSKISQTKVVRYQSAHAWDSDIMITFPDTEYHVLWELWRCITTIGQPLTKQA